MNRLLSGRSSTASATAGSVKLGQPVPESNLVSALNSVAAAGRAAVVAGVLVVDVLARERRLGAGLAQHLVLRGRQLLAPLLVGLHDLRLARGHASVLALAERPARPSAPSPDGPTGPARCYLDLYVHVRFFGRRVARLSTARSRRAGTGSGAGASFGVAAEHEHYSWWALSCTSLGMLLAATNSGTLIIALPDLERSLHTSLLALVWVILAYLIAATVLVLMAGRLSDLFGRKRAYVGGFLLFAFASLGAGFSSDATVLILWRILQGIGSAFLFANAAALVTDAFPQASELGLAMGANTMVAAIGLVLGPVLGGALVAISWHWVFWFNVPLALGGAAWGALILRELAKPDTVRGYDVLGTTTFVVGLTGPRARRLQGRPQRLERPDRDRRPGSRRPCCCRRGW